MNASTDFKDATYKPLCYIDGKDNIIHMDKDIPAGECEMCGDLNERLTEGRVTQHGN